METSTEPRLHDSNGNSGSSAHGLVLSMGPICGVGLTALIRSMNTSPGSALRQARLAMRSNTLRACSMRTGSPLRGLRSAYSPSAAKIKGEESGEGDTDNIEKYNTYRQMLADWFNEAPEKAVSRVEEFEIAAKKKFISLSARL